MTLNNQLSKVFMQKWLQTAVVSWVDGQRELGVGISESIRNFQDHWQISNDDIPHATLMRTYERGVKRKKEEGNIRQLAACKNLDDPLIEIIEKRFEKVEALIKRMRDGSA